MANCLLESVSFLFFFLFLFISSALLNCQCDLKEACEVLLYVGDAPPLCLSGCVVGRTHDEIYRLFYKKQKSCPCSVNVCSSLTLSLANFDHRSDAAEVTAC